MALLDGIVGTFKNEIVKNGEPLDLVEMLTLLARVQEDETRKTILLRASKMIALLSTIIDLIDEREIVIEKALHLNNPNRSEH